MKILFLSAANSIHTIRWVNTLSKRGHEVHLVYNSDHKPTVDKIDNKVIKHELKYGGVQGYYLNAFELYKLAKGINADIINAHYASGYGTLVRLARLKKLAPILLSVWGSDVYDFPYQNKIKMKILLKNLLYANEIASTSLCMADQVKKLLFEVKESKKINITYFGVDVNKFKRKRTKKDSNSIIIGNIKTLDEKYGIEDLITAIKILKDDLINSGNAKLAELIKVVIYGDGYQKEELISLTNKLELDNFIEFKGRIANKQVPSALEDIDIFCVTSRLNSESFGVAVIEAMAMELPVVATNVDGFKEVIIDKKTGIIVKKKDCIEIADALKQLIINSKLRNAMGNEGRKRVMELYNWEENVKRMESIYSTLIINNRA